MWINKEEDFHGFASEQLMFGCFTYLHRDLTLWLLYVNPEIRSDDFNGNGTFTVTRVYQDAVYFKQSVSKCLTVNFRLLLAEFTRPKQFYSTWTFRLWLKSQTA